MLSRLAFAQEDHSNRRDQDKNADDLKRQIVIAEKQRADIANVVGRDRASSVEKVGQRI